MESNQRVNMVTFEKPFILNNKYNLTSNDFIIMDLKKITQKGRHQTQSKPTQEYNEKLHIEKVKLKDLLSLCKMGLFR